VEVFEMNLRTPTPEDGIRVNKLIAACPPLDTNSAYCNLLQCTHFAQTSVAAEISGELAGFISGYILPEQPETLFVWQVAVGESARGMGLATRMLEDILSRDACKSVNYIDTTITESNRASWALFERMAQRLEAPLNHSVMFDKDKHFNGEHDSEMLVRVGPFSSLAARSA